ncbi:MAG: S46 family peptidase, partial [Candidatus Hydrogenedentes bacterium]|nr:S46 family peptidase [Candidatus Hydrogenedentota bacterium]
MLRCTLWIRSVLMLPLLCAVSIADEGMWLFTNPPVEQLDAKYDFAPSLAWLDHVQQSALRFNTGGSASFVSDEGLVLTNHHVGSGIIENLSTPEANLLETGFFARSRDDELVCPDVEVNMLVRIIDVTDRVVNAGSAVESLADANVARREEISAIEDEFESETGLDCQVVTLYRGEQYHLYQYKRFTDIRLVMAPELQVAYYGGDNDNFEYPRYALDMCFFRVYENDAPYRPEHFLTWSREGASEGELVLVAGHPGHTQRLTTVAHLEFLRDVEIPHRLRQFWRREVQLQTFSKRDPEFERMAKAELYGVQNGRKAYTAILAGLQDPAIFALKETDERVLREAVLANPEYREPWGGAWDEIVRARDTYRSFFERHRTGIHSHLYGIAVDLVRLSAELPKPSVERLPEYADSNLDSLYRGLYTPSPVYDAQEMERIESSLAHIAATFGADDPYTQAALGGMSPRERAVALVTGTTLKDVGVRKALAEGGAKAIAESTDPMIQLAIALDDDARQWRKKYEDDVESVEKDAYAKIAAARFAIEGNDVYPDATFTLRLAFGQVKGYS